MDGVFGAAGFGRAEGGRAEGGAGGTDAGGRGEVSIASGDTSSTSSSSSSLETFSASGTERRSTRGITEGGAGVGGGGNPPLGPGRGSAATEITGAAPLVLRDGTGGALGGLGTERPCWGGGGGTGAAALDFFLGPPGEIERAGAFEPGPIDGLTAAPVGWSSAEEPTGFDALSSGTFREDSAEGGEAATLLEPCFGRLGF